MSILLKTIIILIMSNVVFTQIVEAQTGYSEDDLIMISGKVNCAEPFNRGLTFVSIYNTSKGWGTISDTEGGFKIKMGKYDTIVFFTAEHKDSHYFLKSGDEFKNHTIAVYMETDAVWLEAVNIIGMRSLDEFKIDVLNMEVTEDNIFIAGPDLNKYAKELTTGKPAPVLLGPLTYLMEKFRVQNLRKRKMQKVIMDN